MKVTLINCSCELTSKVREKSKNANIHCRPLNNLKQYATVAVQEIEGTDLIIILLNKDTFNITSILTILALAKKDVSKIFLLIDAQYMSKEEQCLFDDVIEEITDFISCIIVDDEDDIETAIVNYIKNYSLK